MVVLGLGAFAVAASCCAGARRDADDPALARLLGVGARAALAARSLLPTLLSAAWLTVALAVPVALGHLPGTWLPLGPLCAPAMAAGALRLAHRPPLDHTHLIVDSTGAGLPLGPFLWALVGIDIAALGSIPLLYALATSTDPGLFLAAQALFGLATLALFLLFAPRRRT